MLTLHLALPVFVLHLCVLYICIDYMTRDAACQARYLMFSFPQVKWTGGDLTECLASDTKPANSIICQNLEAQRLLPLDWYNSCFLTWPGFFWLRHGALEKEAGGGGLQCVQLEGHVSEVKHLSWKWVYCLLMEQSFDILFKHIRREVFLSIIIHHFATGHFPYGGGGWGVCLLETFCFHCRLHDGDGLMGRGDITHSPVSGAKGENRMSHLFFFLFAHRGCAQSHFDLLLASRSSKINRNVYWPCTQRHTRHTWSCSERL